MNILRRLLDFIYFASGALAAVSLVAILLLIVVQMVARWTGEVFPGAASYAGYAMAAASFLRPSLICGWARPRVCRPLQVPWYRCMPNAIIATM